MSRLDNVDLTKKENQTLKNWAILCWENWYFQILAFFIIFQQVILHNVDLNEPKVKLYINIGFGFVYFLLLFKGFYQHWNDLCKGTSR